MTPVDVRPNPQTQEEKLREALIWCGGSNDFSPGGKAHEGWKKIVLPLLRKPSA